METFQDWKEMFENKLRRLHYRVSLSELTNTCFQFLEVAIFNQMVINVSGKTIGVFWRDNNCQHTWF